MSSSTLRPGDSLDNDDPRAPRSVGGALDFLQQQHDKPSQDWEGWCLKLVREAYGIPPLCRSAWAAWLIVDDADRHEGGKPSDAPVGAALFYKGSGPFGHIMVAAHPLPDGTPAAWSNDLPESAPVGTVNKISRTLPTTAWGQRFVGWSSEVNGYELDVRGNRVPRPKGTPYVVLERSRNRLRAAAIKADERGEKVDAAALREEAARLDRLVHKLRKGDAR